MHFLAEQFHVYKYAFIKKNKNKKHKWAAVRMVAVHCDSIKSTHGIEEAMLDAFFSLFGCLVVLFRGIEKALWKIPAHALLSRMQARCLLTKCALLKHSQLKTRNKRIRRITSTYNVTTKIINRNTKWVEKAERERDTRAHQVQ